MQDDGVRDGPEVRRGRGEKGEKVKRERKGNQ